MVMYNNKRQQRMDYAPMDFEYQVKQRSIFDDEIAEPAEPESNVMEDTHQTDMDIDSSSNECFTSSQQIHNYEHSEQDKENYSKAVSNDAKDDKSSLVEQQQVSKFMTNGDHRQQRQSNHGANDGQFKYLVLDLMPGIIQKWVMAGYNLFLYILFIVVVLYSLYSIYSDFNMKAQSMQRRHSESILKCTQHYEDNKCHPSTRVPALQTLCTEWLDCMNAPHEYGSMRIWSLLVADVIETFIQSLSFKTLLIIGVFVIVNLVFRSYRSAGSDINYKQVKQKGRDGLNRSLSDYHAYHEFDGSQDSSIPVRYEYLRPVILSGPSFGQTAFMQRNIAPSESEDSSQRWAVQRQKYDFDDE
ncbi:hypothetical protein MP228_005625 [Amoeboaphelidium protococcarum]|nr:hypothetical protein MP228_005625 [Amoeboaphelidium protococcarum]